MPKNQTLSKNSHARLNLWAKLFFGALALNFVLSLQGIEDLFNAQMSSQERSPYSLSICSFNAIIKQAPPASNSYQWFTGWAGCLSLSSSPSPLHSNTNRIFALVSKPHQFQIYSDEIFRLSFQVLHENLGRAPPLS